MYLLAHGFQQRTVGVGIGLDRAPGLRGLHPLDQVQSQAPLLGVAHSCDEGSVGAYIGLDTRAQHPVHNLAAALPLTICSQGGDEGSAGDHVGLDLVLQHLVKQLHSPLPGATSCACTDYSSIGMACSTAEGHRSDKASRLAVHALVTAAQAWPAAQPKGDRSDKTLTLAKMLVHRQP